MSLSTLKQKQEALALEIAEYMNNLLQEASEILSSETMTEATTRMQEIHDEMIDGVAKTQVNNFLTIMQYVPRDVLNAKTENESLLTVVEEPQV